MEGWRVIRKLWRVKMGAAAIYILIGVLAFTACVSIAITGNGDAGSETGIDREVDIETDTDIEESQDETE